MISQRNLWAKHISGMLIFLIFRFFRYFWHDPFSVFSCFISLFLNFLSLFLSIFCTRRFSVIFAKVQWYPWYISLQSNNKDFISIALFHVKHAQFCWTMQMNDTHTHTHSHKVSPSVLTVTCGVLDEDTKTITLMYTIPDPEHRITWEWIHQQDEQ